MIRSKGPAASNAPGVSKARPASMAATARMGAPTGAGSTWAATTRSQPTSFIAARTCAMRWPRPMTPIRQVFIASPPSARTRRLEDDCTSRRALLGFLLNGDNQGPARNLGDEEDGHEVHLVQSDAVAVPVSYTHLRAHETG